MGIRYDNYVDYGKLDPFKRQALETFQSTFKNPEERLRIRVAPVGEAAAVLDFLDYDFMIAFNVEGLGTKNRICDTLRQELKAKADIGKGMGAEAYRFIGQDAVAMSVNDLSSVGADPIAYGDLIPSGDDDWFDDLKRNEELLYGYKIAADLAGCAIPCGETPTLRGVVNPDTLVLEGASIGLIRPKSRFTYGQELTEGDVIYGWESSGIHANGVTKAREIAEKLPEGYHTPLPSGVTIGEALLKPTYIYSRPVIRMFEKGVEAHYMQLISGHSWKKIMRGRFPFTYVIDNVPEPQEEFLFLIEEGRKLGYDVSPFENYKVWNMRLGWVNIAPKEYGDDIEKVGEEFGMKTFELGRVEKGEKMVVIRPLDIVYRD
jgi:phosphoribosylformylglycinamidine cyclo-ligase